MTSLADLGGGRRSSLLKTLLAGQAGLRWVFWALCCYMLVTNLPMNPTAKDMGSALKSRRGSDRDSVAAGLPLVEPTNPLRTEPEEEEEEEEDKKNWWTKKENSG